MLVSTYVGEPPAQCPVLGKAWGIGWNCWDMNSLLRGGIVDADVMNCHNVTHEPRCLVPEDHFLRLVSSPVAKLLGRSTHSRLPLSVVIDRHPNRPVSTTAGTA